MRDNSYGALLHGEATLQLESMQIECEAPGTQVHVNADPAVKLRSHHQMSFFNPGTSLMCKIRASDGLIMFDLCLRMLEET